ncbi:unnamed protein product [Brassica oleracea]
MSITPAIPINTFLTSISEGINWPLRISLEIQKQIEIPKQTLFYQPIAKSNSYTLLENLRAGRCSNTAEVHLLRFWEAKNINKARELMSVDMLLIDENSTVVHGSIPASRQLRFKNRLSEGSVYTLSGFDVTRSSPKYRLSDAPVSVPFNDETDFEKLPATDRIIPTEHFRFRPYEQIVELANTGD